MSGRLVVHAHVPRSGSGLLNRTIFVRSFTRGETMLAYGSEHGRMARHPGVNCAEVAARVGRARLAIGHVPYGYFDDFGRWTIYVSVFDDPVRRFLGFAGAIIMKRNAAAATGDDASCDPDEVIRELLAQEDILLRQANMMTRIAAGLPAFGAAMPRRGHLDVACANVARSNYLVATRDQIPAFEGYIADVLGGPAGAGDSRDWCGAVPACKLARRGALGRADVSARSLRLIEAANDLDMRLYEAVMRRNAVCWAA